MREALLKADVRALLAVPLLREERIVGALHGSASQSRVLSDKPVIDLMQSFASQSALAIQNARLFQEIEDKSRQLELASQHKSQFLANMSHELRTPLNAILGYTELMQDGLYGELPAKTTEVLDRVQKNGKHLLGLINDVLDLAKIEAGQLVLGIEDYSMQDVVQTVVSATESLAAAKELPLKVEILQGHAPWTRRRAPHCAGSSQSRRQRHQVHGHGRGPHCRQGSEWHVSGGRCRYGSGHSRRGAGAYFP